MKSVMDKIVELVNTKTDLLIQLAIGIGIIILFRIFSSYISYAIIKIFYFKIKDKKKIKENSFYKPIKLLITIIGWYIAVILFNIPEDIMVHINKFFKIAVIAIIAKGFANCVEPDSTLFNFLKSKNRLAQDDTVGKFISKILKSIIYIIAGFIIIYELGYNLNGLVASLGLGSVIIALAAQDIAKNLFGGVAIFIDKPFVIGDWIQTNSFEGIVEDITFRSTRIRTFENSVVNIPNSTISNESVINWSKMERRRYKIDLLVALETPLDKLQEVSDKISLMLQNYSSVINDTIHVTFDEIKESGINLLVYVYTDSVDYDSYLAAKEKINYNILKILEHDGIELAYPTRSIYIKK